jgi:hypothetical protein
MPEYTQGLAGEIFANGIYDFQVVDAGEKESVQTHNTMIELQLDCFNDDATQKVRVVDRLVFTPNSYWKIDSFRKSTGERINAQGKVSFEAEDCIDRRGKLSLKTTMYNGKARNEVDYYVEPDEQEEAADTSTGGAATAATGVAASAGSQSRSSAPKGTVPKSSQPF